MSHGFFDIDVTAIDGSPKLLDFRIAKVLAADGDESSKRPR